MTKNIGILIVDDEFSVRNSLYNWFKEDGYRVEAAENGVEVLKKLQENPWDIILLDIKMPGMDGMELQKRINEIDKSITIIFMTAYASIETAVQALKSGAFDYVTKPIDPDDLNHIIRNAIKQKELIAENIQLREKIEELSNYDEIIGESPAMQKIFGLVDMVVKTDSTVMIRGESGTGKELVAKAIHSKSSRRYFPIITINCAAFPDTLLESELFGHEKGAFTGAQYRRKGKLELAHGGTIFFDEIGNISLKTQVDLLRVIETKQFARLGGNETINVDFRIIAATNSDLEKAIKDGTFREDLYYRLNVFSIFLPPLRERINDIPVLTQHFIKKFAISMHKNITGITPDAMDILVRYNWPGNVRELENAVERAMVVGKGPLIRSEDLPFQIIPGASALCTDTLEDIEKNHILKILNRTDWNITHAAETLQIDRVTLYNKIKKYELTRENVSEQ
ncbi:MAG: sigma-54-dependent Fis family transcriptional regulator [Candidatus Schekmanbacteria bacterium]|nr:sigma-54-dependent Fis family transcriptional regulator [Candidatus Schekmanbacteria bacterium]